MKRKFVFFLVIAVFNGIMPMEVQKGPEKLRFVNAETQNYFDMVRNQLENGTDVNLRDDMGRTQLYDAIVHGRYDVVELLLLYGALIDDIESNFIPTQDNITLLAGAIIVQKSIMESSSYLKQFYRVSPNILPTLVFDMDFSEGYLKDLIENFIIEFINGNESQKKHAYVQLGSLLSYESVHNNFQLIQQAIDQLTNAGLLNDMVDLLSRVFNYAVRAGSMEVVVLLTERLYTIQNAVSQSDVSELKEKVAHILCTAISDEQRDQYNMIYAMLEVMEVTYEGVIGSDQVRSIDQALPVPINDLTTLVDVNDDFSNLNTATDLQSSALADIIVSDDNMVLESDHVDLPHVDLPMEITLPTIIDSEINFDMLNATRQTDPIDQLFARAPITTLQRITLNSILWSLRCLPNELVHVIIEQIKRSVIKEKMLR